MPDIGGIPADVASMPVAPALSATSDAPVVTPVVPAVVEGTDNAATDITTEGQAADQAAATEGADGTADAGDGETKPAARDRSFGTRISEVTRQRDAAREVADRLSADLSKAIEALAAVAVPKQPDPATAPAAVQPDPRPGRDAFADPDSYDAALIEWSTRQATRIATAEFERQAEVRRTAEETERTNAEQVRQADTARENWNQRQTKVVEAHPDFNEVAFAEDLTVSATMANAILHAPDGPDVLYHLGKNHAEAARIAALPPLQQVIEIGRLGATIATQNRPRASAAPAPIEPVNQGRNNAAPKSPAEMTTEEYAASRMPKLQAERRASSLGQRVN